MKQIIFYTKENCPLCDDVYALLKLFQNYYHFDLIERDIYSNDDWLEEFQLLIPVVELGDRLIDCEEINYDVLEEAIKDYTS